MKSLLITSLSFVILLSGIVVVYSDQPLNTPLRTDINIYSHKVVNTYPHDRSAFTQGLTFEDGCLYEGTGLYGRSSLRRVDLQTGRVLKIHNLPPNLFGEGVTIAGNKIIQLTYKSHTGFVYDKNTFVLLKTFGYPTEGWGITYDGKMFIMSDGTSNLRFLDSETFKVIKTIAVHDHLRKITGINELEFVQGEIFANIWQEDRLARIDPETGQITGWIELPGLLKSTDFTDDIDVLNGIAYDAGKNRLFVTGKLWPKLFEIELVKRK